MNEGQETQGGQLVVTIGILTWQSREMLKNLLDSILATPPKCSFEILVVDNASTDGTPAMLAADYPAVRVIRNQTNQGVAPARNQIFRDSRATYVLILDVDTLVPAGAMDRLVEVMEAHPDVAIAGPRLTYADGRLQLSCRPFPNILNILIRGSFLKDLFPNSRHIKDYIMADWDHAETREVDWMFGACLLIRRSVLDQIGHFDEKFFYLYEDVDLCFRAKKAGFKVLYVADATVIHLFPREAKGTFHPRIRSHLKSIVRYFAKNRLGLVH